MKHNLYGSFGGGFLALLVGLSFFSALYGKEGEQWLFFEGKEGQLGSGKHVVLISGDEEYRSEEGMPMLGKILSQHHGFDCTVLFAMHPDGYIDPNYVENIPGLEALEKADLMILQTRMRKLPPEQMKHFVSYLNAGKPIIGLRTATHAFDWKWEYKTGEFLWKDFGVKVLGENWVAHHGKHKVEGGLAVAVPGKEGHEVLKGVGKIFTLSDIYTVKEENVNPDNAEIVLLGAITETLDPNSKVLIDDERNDPKQALAWFRDYTSVDGKTKGKAFTTTAGSSIDFESEGLRRLVVNAAFVLTGI